MVEGFRSPQATCQSPACALEALALQLPFLKISESMGNHDSKIVGAGRVG